MPTVTRAFIKASLAYLAAALGLQIWQAIPELAVPGLSPVYFHFFLVGWVTQMIMGVAHWFFPKFSPELPRRSERLAWAVFGLLNGGLLLRGVAEQLYTGNPAPGWGAALAASAALQWLAAVLFVVNVWGRVKER